MSSIGAKAALNGSIASAAIAVPTNDPLAGMTLKQIYRDCIWLSDEDTDTKILLLCVERFMEPDLRSSSMSYAQIARDCSFSDRTAKRCAKAARDNWLIIGVNKGHYVPGKGCANLYHGIVPPRWLEQLRRDKLEGKRVTPDPAIAQAADRIVARMSGVSSGHPEGVHGVSDGHPGDHSGVSARHPETQNAQKAGCPTDTAVSGRHPNSSSSSKGGDHARVSDGHPRNQLIVTADQISGPGFVIDLAAVDMEAALRGLTIEFARKKVEAMARQWVATKKAPPNPDATIARALREEANAKAVQSMRLNKATGGGTSGKSRRREIDEA